MTRNGMGGSYVRGSLSARARMPRRGGTYAVGTNHVRAEKKPGIRPRSNPHVAHSNVPTSKPKRRFDSTPHACQSQSPAHELVDEAGSAEAEERAVMEVEL